MSYSTMMMMNTDLGDAMVEDDYDEFDPSSRHHNHDPEVQEQFDITREILTEGNPPFPIDRQKLRMVVGEAMGSSALLVKFLSAGTFHKAFLVTLEDGREVVARIARRFMPRLKTESEVATMTYIRTQTNVPVPTIYLFNSNPYNSLGGEYILMSKAPGIPLLKIYSRLPPSILQTLFLNLATHMHTLFSHRFSQIGSLYTSSTSSKSSPSFMVGPIVSWPFFGEGRGEQDLPRGPWRSMKDYLEACSEREIDSVRREGEGRIKGHRPHLPPRDADESSGEEEDEEDSEEDGVGFYRDYRSKQRSSLLVAHAAARVRTVKREMKRFLKHMKTLGISEEGEKEEFTFDLHDLSLANIFVDAEDHSRITCIIDWESTTIRPLWQCAHLPSFIHSQHHTTSRPPHLLTTSPRAPHGSAAPSLSSPTRATFINALPIRPTPTANNSFQADPGGGRPKPSDPISIPRFLSSKMTPSMDSPMMTFSPDTPFTYSSSTTRPHNNSYFHYSSSSLLQLHHHHHIQQQQPRPDPPELFRHVMTTLHPNGALWLTLEREFWEARRVHKVVEWDGWEEGLVDSVIGPCSSQDEDQDDDDEDECGGMSFGAAGGVLGGVGVGVGGLGVGVGLGGLRVSVGVGGLPGLGRGRGKELINHSGIGRWVGGGKGLVGVVGERDPLKLGMDI